MTMSPMIQCWPALRPLLEQAMDLDGEPLQAFLDEIRIQQPDLHDPLVRLLAQHRNAVGLDRPAAEIAADVLLGAAADPPGEVRALAARHIGRRVGPFELRRLVGSGGMGAVYEAERVSGGFRQKVAVKLIGGMHPGLAERFARERQILADLKHPNIPLLFDGGQTEDGTPWFATELVEGETLIEYASRINADADVRLELLLGVAEALAYAHQRRVIHRDIKPGNILVSADGTVKLLDFGIARLLDETHGAGLTGQMPGPMTPEYAAPEQFQGEEAGVATDIYQFGVLCHRLLSGGMPYRSDASSPLAFARAVCEEPPLPLPPPGPSTTGDVRRRSAALQAIVSRCLAKSPAERYPDMHALMDDLASVRADAYTAVRHLVRRPPRAARWPWLAAGLAAVVLAGLWLLLLKPAPEDPWLHSPALHALGLDRTHLHAERDDTEVLLRRALMAEARGDVSGALALLESVHAADSRTPVPAMLLAYWGSSQSDRTRVAMWLEQARVRLQRIDDPVLHLLHRFIETELAVDYEQSLRYAAALLELKPRAWFLRLARAHLLQVRGLTSAGLRELQQIEVDVVDHRKLIEAIGDRASFGDAAGARLLAHHIEGNVPSHLYAHLQGRLAYSAGDLDAARQHFSEAVSEARDAANFVMEARGLLYLGLVEGSLGLEAAASASLRQAQHRLGTRDQFGFAVDATLALAQLAANGGDADKAATEIQTARSLRIRQRGHDRDPMIALFAARLLQQPTEPWPGLDPVQADLLLARAALIAGNRAQAIDLARRAGSREVSDHRWLEEYALLCRDLGLSEPELPPLDPLFAPLARFASRWALGADVMPRASSNAVH